MVCGGMACGVAANVDAGVDVGVDAGAAGVIGRGVVACCVVASHCGVLGSLACDVDVPWPALQLVACACAACNTLAA